MNIKEITNEIRDKVTNAEKNQSDEDVQRTIEEYIFSHPQFSMKSSKEIHKMVQRIFHSIRSDLDILQPYVEDDQVSEIMVNGPKNIFIEKQGYLRKVDIEFEDQVDLEEVIRRVASRVHKEINELNPIVDARLADGSRVNAVYKNIAINGPILTIRKFPEKAFTMKEMIAFGTLTNDCARFLGKLVMAGYNCFISGGTSSGKTTFLNVLSDYIPSKERVIVIEDSAELQIRNIENIVRMECKNANTEGRGSIQMAQLIKTSLRMRPDRIIVGEVRGKEVMDMINAMNTGHDGSLCTGHGNSVNGMLRRLESMFLQAADFPIDAIRSQITEGIDIIIHLGRLPDKSRKILEVAELTEITDGIINTNILYKYTPNQGLKSTENGLKNKEKLLLKGYENEHRLFNI